MLDAFEKHLNQTKKDVKALKFSDAVSQAKTVEEQVELCKKFLDDNRPSLVPPELGINIQSQTLRSHYNNIGGANVRWYKAKAKVDADLILASRNPTLLMDETKKNLVYELLQQILADGCILFEEERSPEFLDHIYYACVGVVK